MQDYGLIFKLLSDTLSIKLLRILIIEDLYSKQLADSIGKSPSTINVKLNNLESAGLISSYPFTAKTGRRVKKYHFEDQQLPFRSVQQYIESIPDDA